MKRIASWMTATCAAGALCLATTALAQAPGSPPEKVSSASVTVTATVVSVDQKTREVTLKADDGNRYYTFIASDEVKNLAQLKKGDRVTTTYKESTVYEVKKGGKASVETATVKGSAPPGSMPAAVWSERTTLTVKITAIDPKVPTITFTGPTGNTRTIKVQDPAKLKGVNVGDTVEITYVEAVAIKVERAPK